MILSAQSIKARCLLEPIAPLITPFIPEKRIQNGKSFGLSASTYDVRIDHDLTLGVNPAYIIESQVEKEAFHHDLWDTWLDEGQIGYVLRQMIEQRRILAKGLKSNASPFQLAFTAEDFHMPPDLCATVVDKSTYARVFVSAFNTLMDPGFQGNLTLELVNLGNKPVEYKQGDPVCQIMFHQLDRATDRPYDGKYQHQTKAAHGPRYEEGGDGNRG